MPVRLQYTCTLAIRVANPDPEIWLIKKIKDPSLYQYNPVNDPYGHHYILLPDSRSILTFDKILTFIPVLTVSEHAGDADFA
jgi:hypothetical protein